MFSLRIASTSMPTGRPLWITVAKQVTALSQLVKAYKALIAFAGFASGESVSSMFTFSAVKSSIALTGTFFFRMASSIDAISDSVVVP